VVMSMGVPTHAVQGKVVTSAVTILNTDPEPAVTFTTASQQKKESAGEWTSGWSFPRCRGRTWRCAYGKRYGEDAGKLHMTAGPLVIKAGELSASVR